VHRRPESRDGASDVVLKVGDKPRSSDTLGMATKRRISERKDKRRSQTLPKQGMISFDWVSTFYTKLAVSCLRDDPTSEIGYHKVSMALEKKRMRP
jgi:hypothetical protein